jgi:hypothetical protein
LNFLKTPSYLIPKEGKGESKLKILLFEALAKVLNCHPELVEG